MKSKYGNKKTIVDGILYGKSDTKVAYYPPDAPDAVFVMPSWVNAFGQHCFYGCTNLENLELDTKP